MINAAKTDFPGGEWLLGDIASLQPREPYDLYFANAALQWLPNHETLLPRLLGLVRPGGALAVQVPDMGDSPLAKSVVWVAHQPYWRELTAESERTVNYRSAEYYFPILNSLKARFELWQTTYYHVLPSQTALLDWYRGTGLKPFLDRLPDETFRTKFLGEIFQQIAPYYPGETDGRVVLPFKRVFFTIYR
jgi:trans-aconitate 2-methyltransferase